jgi:hypothetical protein
MGDFLRQGKVALKGLRAAEVTSEVEQVNCSLLQNILARLNFHFSSGLCYA